MIEMLPSSHDTRLGYRVEGDVTASDYEVLTPAVRNAVEEHGSVRLLLDMTDFRWEKAEAWGADLRFGEQFHDSVERMAIVGHHTWERWLARLAEPFYAQQSRFFTTQDQAWEWIEE